MSEKVKLGDICTIVTGSTPKTNIPEYWDGNIDWITPAELNEDSYFVGESNRKITEIAVRKTGLISFPKGTVIFSSRAPIGKVAIASKEMYCNQGFKNLICGSRIYNEYLYWYLKGNISYLKSLGRGATFKEISKKIIENVEMELPSLIEQKKIVCKLKKCHGIIQLRKKELQILDELVKARFIEFFGDPVINIYKYPEHMLGENVEFLTSGSRGWAKYYSKKGKMFITIKNVKDGQILTNNIQYITPPDNAEARRTKVQNGDLLISITADLGRTAVVPQEIAEKGAYINQHLMCVRLNKKVLLPEYVSFFMESEAGKRQFYAKNQNAVKAGLNFDAIKTFKIMVPPLEKQNKYISFTKRVNKSKFTIDSCIVIIRKALQSGYHYVWGICHDQF